MILELNVLTKAYIRNGIVRYGNYYGIKHFVEKIQI